MSAPPRVVFPCECDTNPATLEGPQEHCPMHGNPQLFANWLADRDRRIKEQATEIRRLQGLIHKLFSDIDCGVKHGEALLDRIAEQATEIEQLRADLERTRQAWVDGEDPMCEDVCVIACKGPCGAALEATDKDTDKDTDKETEI